MQENGTFYEPVFRAVRGLTALDNQSCVEVGISVLLMCRDWQACLCRVLEGFI